VSLVDIIFDVEADKHKDQGSKKLSQENLPVCWKPFCLIDDLRVEWVLPRHVVKCFTFTVSWHCNSEQVAEAKASKGATQLGKHDGEGPTGIC